MKIDHSILTDAMSQLFSHIPPVYARQVARNVINRNGLDQQEVEEVLDTLIWPARLDPVGDFDLEEYETSLLRFLLHEALNDNVS